MNTFSYILCILVFGNKYTLIILPNLSLNFCPLKRVGHHEVFVLFDWRVSFLWLVFELNCLFPGLLDLIIASDDPLDGDLIQPAYSKHSKICVHYSIKTL